MAALTETPATETAARSRVGTFINLMFGYDGRIGRLYCFLGFLAFVAIVGFLSGIAEDATAGTGDIGRYVAFVFIVGTGHLDAFRGDHQAAARPRQGGRVVPDLWDRTVRILHRRDLFLDRPRVRSWHRSCSCCRSWA